MTAFQWAVSLATNLIQSNGTSASLARDTEGAYDPVTQVETTPGTTTEAVTAVELPLGADDVRFLPEGLVLESASKVLVAAEGTTLVPAPGDRLTINGRTLAIVSAQRLQPDGTDIVFTTICRA